MHAMAGRRIRVALAPTGVRGPYWVPYDDRRLPQCPVRRCREEGGRGLCRHARPCGGCWCYARLMISVCSASSKISSCVSLRSSTPLNLAARTAWPARRSAISTASFCFSWAAAVASYVRARWAGGELRDTNRPGGATHKPAPQPGACAQPKTSPHAVARISAFDLVVFDIMARQLRCKLRAPSDQSARASPWWRRGATLAGWAGAR